MSRARRLLLSAASTAASLFALARPAAAQNEHLTGVDGHMESIAGLSYHCDYPANQTFTYVCNGPTAKAELFASVDLTNKLHASVNLTSKMGITTPYRARAEAFYTDRLEFYDTAPAELVFTVILHGRVDGDANNAHADLLGYNGKSEPVWGIGMGQTGSGFQQDTGYFHVLVADGVALWGLRLITRGFIDPSVDGLCDVCYRALADFSQTAYVGNITALDASGATITSGLRAQTASGVAYDLTGGIIVTATPEPATLALMGTGVGALGLMLRRRRRHAA